MLSSVNMYLKLLWLVILDAEGHITPTDRPVDWAITEHRPFEGAAVVGWFVGCIRSCPKGDAAAAAIPPSLSIAR